MEQALSTERCLVLDGWLRYRAALHAAGLRQGFQWLDGSFLERIEQIEERPPQDLDVVTFFALPPGLTQQAVFDRSQGAIALTRAARQQVKHVYKVDGYYVDLDGGDPRLLVRQSTYWYSMWSHRRTQAWKGYVQVDLDPAEDAAAAKALAVLNSQRGPA